jgi:hypothetical protein
MAFARANGRQVACFAVAYAAAIFVAKIIMKIMFIDGTSYISASDIHRICRGNDGAAKNFLNNFWRSAGFFKKTVVQSAPFRRSDIRTER